MASEVAADPSKTRHWIRDAIQRKKEKMQLSLQNDPFIKAVRAKAVKIKKQQALREAKKEF